ncbi:hypothetical protein EDD86DRAFT_248335 [Gorgonomyces haynaldii]|nr:hypothetical protein EDD86DRAFT_248335 [Gorgonomyces haynaldii]
MDNSFSVSDPLNSVIKLAVHVRIGQPQTRTRRRKEITQEFPTGDFLLDYDPDQDDIHVLRERISENIKVLDDRFLWPAAQRMFLRRNRSDVEVSYQELTETNINGYLLKAHKRSNDQARQIFIYLQFRDAEKQAKVMKELKQEQVSEEDLLQMSDIENTSTNQVIEPTRVKRRRTEATASKFVPLEIEFNGVRQILKFNLAQLREHLNVPNLDWLHDVAGRDDLAMPDWKQAIGRSITSPTEQERALVLKHLPHSQLETLQSLDDEDQKTLVGLLLHLVDQPYDMPDSPLAYKSAKKRI